jgi:GNAT superfamily N-acetyltransferase
MSEFEFVKCECETNDVISKLQAQDLIDYEFDEIDWNRLQDRCTAQGQSLCFWTMNSQNSTNSQNSPALACCFIVEDRSAFNEPSRMLIHYLTTLEEYRGMGLATRMIQELKLEAEQNKMELYVVATEDASLFWYSKGFLLTESNLDNQLYNEDFSDTFLMKLNS